MLLTAILFALTTIVTAQNYELQKWANKTGKTSTSTQYISKKNQSNCINDAGKYLEKSANYQYAGILLTGVGTACTLAGSVVDKKEGQNACYIVGGISAFAALCCQFAAINYKLKAGRSLKLYANESGGGLAYIF